MLTKGDVKVIGDLFDKKINIKVIGDLFDKKFDEKFESAFRKNTASLKEDISQIRKDQKLIVKFFDNEYLNLRKRVERIESYLKLSATN